MWVDSTSAGGAMALVLFCCGESKEMEKRRISCSSNLLMILS